VALLLGRSSIKLTCSRGSAENGLCLPSSRSGAQAAAGEWGDGVEIDGVEVDGVEIEDSRRVILAISVSTTPGNWIN